MTNSLLLLSLASALLTQPGDVRPELVAAIAKVESSGRNLAAYQDTKGVSFGLFGFQKARWAECGGRPERFGIATEAEQVAVMVTAIRRYQRRARQLGKDEFRFICAAHNGHGSEAQKAAYRDKVLAALEGR